MDRSLDPEYVKEATTLLKKHGRKLAISWSVFKGLALVAGVISALLYVTNDTRMATIEGLSSQHSKIATAEANLVGKVRPLISDTSESKHTPTVEQVKEVAEYADAVIATLIGLEAPDRSIRHEAQELQRSIEMLLGAINTYDATKDSYRAFQNAATLSSNKGGDLREEIGDFTSGTWRSFRSVW